MSITVANLIAQIGADTTQFRLGMNEVDARINLTQARFRASSANVARLQEQSIRAADTASRLSLEASRVPVALLTSQFKASYAAAGKARTEMTKAASAYTAAIKTGDAKIAASALKSAEAAKKEFEKLASAAELAGRKMDAAITKRESLLRRSSGFNQMSGDLYIKSAHANEVSTAAHAFDMARAAQAAQDAAEYRVRAINAISSAAVRGGVAIELALGAATKVGAGFNLMLTQAVHNTSLTGKGADIMREAVKTLAMESGADLKQLATSFEVIENYGYSASQSQIILRQAMMASVATGADLNATSELLAGTMKNFHIPVEQSSHAINFLYEVSRQAKGELQDLVKSMGPAFATAANKGVSLTETGAAFVLLTRHQIDASKAVTQFVNVMNKITTPTKQVQTILANVDKQVKDLGISLTRDFSQGGLREKGIIGIFKDIDAATTRLKSLPQDVSAKLIPNLRGTLGATTIAANLKEYIQIQGDLSKAAKNNDLVQKIYNETLKESQVQINRLSNMITIFSGDIAKATLPIVQQLINKSRTLYDYWNQLSASTKQSAVEWAAFGGAALIVVGLTGKLVVGISAVRTALVELGVASEALTFSSMIGGATVLLYRLGALAAALIFVKAGYDALQTKTVPRGHMMTQDEAINTPVDKPGVNGYHDYIQASMSPQWRAGLIRKQQSADYAAKLTKSLQDINRELSTQVVDAKRQKDLITSRNALLRDAAKNNLNVPDAISGVSTFNPFDNAYIKGIPSADKLAGLSAKTPKAKRKSSKLTDDQKELRDANNYIDSLRQALQKVNVEGREGELMWMAHDNAVMKVGGHYFVVAQNMIKTIEAQENQKAATKEGIDLLQHWLEVSNKIEGVTEYDTARAKTQTAVKKGFNAVLGGLTLGMINHAEKVEKASKAQEQYADAMEAVNKPLMKDATVFDDVLGMLSRSAELMEQKGAIWALGVAAQAQANHDAAEKAKAYADAQKAVNEEIGRYNAIAHDRKEMNNVQRAQYDLDSGKFGKVDFVSQFALLDAAWSADQMDTLKKSADGWGTWGEGVLSTVNTTTKRAVELSKAWKDRFLPIWQELADGMGGVFETMFNDMREKGFGAFFSSIISGFENMLYQMAVKWASSQLVRMIVGAVGGYKAQDALGFMDIFTSAAGFFSGGGTGGSAGDIAGGAIGAALGGRAASIPSGQVVHVWNITTPNAQSFIQSKSEVQAKISRAVSLSNKRNGR